MKHLLESDKISIKIQDKWQKIVNILAKTFNIPSALIMRQKKDYIEIFLSSKSKGNPYEKGEKAAYYRKCGLYCETVIRTNNYLLIPNALKDKKWNKNPDIKSGMISYLGYPIILPDKTLFGTICVLDNKENKYNPLFKSLLIQFKNLVESDLEIIYDNIELRHLNKELKIKIKKISTLEKLLPICASCKKIRDKKNKWHNVESYFQKKIKVDFTHGICPECQKKLYPNY